MSNKTLFESLDGIFSASAVGSLDKALTNNNSGYNAMQIGSLLQPSQDQQGYLFVTRPQINLQKDNLRNVAHMYSLLNEDPSSVGLAVRCLLDPRIGAGYSYRIGPKGAHKFIAPLRSLLIDNTQAFFPFITNQAISSSGWANKDLSMGSTDKGLYGQTYSFVDGISRKYEEWDLTINVQNVKGDLAIATFAMLMDYMSAIKEELMVPYPDYLMNNREDFQMRAYRIVVDRNKEYVTKILASGAMAITSVPYGMFGDFDRNTPFSEQTKELPFRFRCMGQVNNDPRLIYGFNGTVRAFQPAMADNHRPNHMRLVSRRYLPRFQYRVYPHINEETLRLEWWTLKSVWDAVMGDTSAVKSFTEL